MKFIEVIYNTLKMLYIDLGTFNKATRRWRICCKIRYRIIFYMAYSFGCPITLNIKALINAYIIGSIYDYSNYDDKIKRMR